MRKLKYFVYFLIFSLILTLTFLRFKSNLFTNPVMEYKPEPGISDGEITIGSSSALGGYASFLGNQFTQGSLALFKDINRNGGVNGRKIRFIRYDDKYDPPLAVANTNKLILKDKVFILFGYVGTPTAKVIVPLVNKFRIPLIGLFTGAEFLRNPLQPNIFNIRASYFGEEEYIIDLWISQGKKKIAVFYQDDAFGLAVLTGAELALSRHKLSPLVVAKFKRGKMPEDNEIKKIVDSKPNAITMVGTYTPLAYFVRRARKMGLTNTDFHTVSFVGSEAFAAELKDIEESAKNRIYVTQVVPSPFNLGNKTVGQYAESYKQYYPKEKLNYVALEGFINAKILLEVLERCGRYPTRKKFVEIIENMGNYDSGIGLSVKMSPQNHSFFEDIFLSKMTKDRFEVIDVNY